MGLLGFPLSIQSQSVTRGLFLLDLLNLDLFFIFERIFILRLYP